MIGLFQQYERGEIPLATVTASVQGWVNHVRYGNTVGLRKKLLTERVIPKQRRRVEAPHEAKATTL